MGNGWWGRVAGLWHGQIGWLFSGFWSRPELERFVPDLLRDRWLVWVDRLYLPIALVGIFVPGAIGWWIEGSWFGGLLGLIWGGLVRVFLTHHITWSINSVCHVFGTRPFRSGDCSTNNWLCAWLGFGEGWHNNHHAFPTSARHGLAWWQFDVGWWVIRAMQGTGLAWNVKLPAAHAVAAKRARRKP
jgi:stearoyl-CoA desaturase (delta-9 desaturase)